MSENHNVVESIDRERIERAVREILEAIGENPDRDGLLDTPARVARMYGEVFRGLHENPREHMHTKFEVEHRELVLVRDIRFYSMCEHHLVPFFGRAHVGYVPGRDGTVAGLSKFARLVEGDHAFGGDEPHPHGSAPLILAKAPLAAGKGIT